MNVLYVLSRDDKYGSPKALLELLLTLKNNYNINPIVLTPMKNNINSVCDSYNIKNYYIPYGTAMKIKGKIFTNILRLLLYLYGNIFSIKNISKIIDFNDIDLIHTNNSVIDFGYKLSKKYHKKHIWHIREFADLDFNYYPFNKEYINNMNESTCIAISKVIYNHWNNRGLNNVKLVYDGIDMESIIQKKEYDIKKIKVLFMGSICSSKRQYEFLKMINDNAKNIFDKIEIHFVGDGDNKYINKIKQFIDKNHYENNIYLDGYINDIRNKIKNYDLGIINSKSEAFGRVTVEYMATGLCVIAPNTGANLELIKNNGTGFIFEDGNGKDLCDKLLFIINNKEKIKDIGIKARHKVCNYFTKEINAKNVYYIYSGLGIMK